MDNAGWHARRKAARHEVSFLAFPFPPIPRSTSAPGRPTAYYDEFRRARCLRPEAPMVNIAPSHKSNRWTRASSEAGPWSHRDKPPCSLPSWTATETRVPSWVFARLPQLRARASPELVIRSFANRPRQTRRPYRGSARRSPRTRCRSSTRWSAPMRSTSGRGR